MKIGTKILLMLFVAFVGLQVLSAQASKGTNFDRINRFNIGSTAVYNLYPPEIKSYGSLSDSLFVATGTEHLYFNNRYYPVRNFADYFKWYVDKNWHLFTNNTEYNYYYLTGNTEAMYNWLLENLQSETEEPNK